MKFEIYCYVLQNVLTKNEVAVLIKKQKQRKIKANSSLKGGIVL